MGIVMNSDDGSPRALQELARHQMIKKLYADILADMQVCEIEGWDKLEYIHQLQDVLNSLTKEAKHEQRKDNVR